MLRLPSPDPVALEMADWAELALIFSPDGVLSRATIIDVLNDELGIDDREDFALGIGMEDDLDADEETAFRQERHEAESEGSAASQNLTDSILRELDFRRQVVGSGYPLEVDGEGAVRSSTWAERPLYPFLCLLGARVAYKLTAVAIHRPARMFEEVTAHAIREYVGGEGVRFGWPRLEDEPVEDFKTKVTELARRMGEDVGRMRNIGPAAKDYGLDVIGWRGFNDGKTPGQLVIVCQCAIGENWAEKILSIPGWREVISFNAEPVGALAFPLVPSREPDDLHHWHDVTTKGNIPLDRLRLASLLREERLPDDLVTRVRSWVAETARLLPEAA